MTELEASGVGEAPPPYMIFLVVFLFFLTGLLGFLVCHLLKKKGYRCRAGEMDDEEEEEEKLEGHADEEHEENQDTVEQILKCIIENEANMEAFNEMLGNHNVCVRHDPRLRKESIGGVPPHLHTVHSGTDHNTCHLCAQVRSKKGRRHSRTPRSKQRPGEQTVFAVGRFRVTHTDKKLPGSPNPLNISRDQLDQSQDSVERKEGGYNLRSLFKDVRSPSENVNGAAVNAGKRRKSLTIFGMRRGSDPVGIKPGVWTGKEIEEVKFSIQQQPVVLEETLQAENAEVGCDSKPSSKPKTNPSSPQHELKTSGSVNSPSSQIKKQDAESGSGLKTNIKPSTAPSSLPISSDKTKEVYSPGPIQTSTPIAPISGFTPVILSTQPEPYSSTDLPVTQSPPDPSSSPDREPGFCTNLALISLGSSPPSSFPVKTLSSASSLKTPTSPLTVTPSPKLSSRNTPTEAKTTLSPALTLSPKLLPGREMSSQSPLSSSSSPVQASSPSPADKHDATALKQQDLEGATRRKTGIKRPGILKTSKLSPGAPEDTKSSAFSPSSDQLLKDKLSILPLSPSSPLPPSSPQGSRISSVTIVKASPDSKREFSVATMVEVEGSSIKPKDPKAETSEAGQLGKGSVSGDGHPDSQSDMSGERVRSVPSQERDDMVEMEDIRDCKVMQVEGVKEEVDKMLPLQSKQDS